MHRANKWIFESGLDFEKEITGAPRAFMKELLETGGIE